MRMGLIGLGFAVFDLDDRLNPARLFEDKRCA